MADPFNKPQSEFQANIDRRNAIGDDETIGDWSKAKLAKFIENQLASHPTALPSSLTGQTVKASKLLIIGDRVQISAQALRYIKDNLPP
jgi:hypothetical protein